MSELTRPASTRRASARRVAFVDAPEVASAASEADRGATRAAEDRPGRVAVRLFDADRSDRELEVAEALGKRLGDRHLLWIDVEGRPDPATAGAIAERLDLQPMTRALLDRPPRGAHVALHGDYVHVCVATEAGHDASESPHWLDVVAKGNVVLTRHGDAIPLLHDLDDRIQADGTIGQLDATAFAATTIDAAVTGYFKAVDDIEAVVDRLDTVALAGDPDRDVLSDLVDVRRRISRLRRVLSGQREVFAAFNTPDFRAAVGDDAEAFGSVASRFDSALQSVENSRELLLGSFDVFMTRTSQRTNDTMKVLALATVLLLPGSLIAGLLGMNVIVPLDKDNPASFWLVLVSILILAGVVLVIARARRWI
jgi:Mg2+ and Co2+ transporter CorA